MYDAPTIKCKNAKSKWIWVGGGEGGILRPVLQRAVFESWSVAKSDVTARHREKIEMLQRVWIANIEEVKLKKKKRKRFAVESEVIEIVCLLPRHGCVLRAL